MGLLPTELSARQTVSVAVITVRDLGMTFPGKKGTEPIDVLRAINLEIMRGEFVCIVGPSGCGKTTPLNIITGFLKQSTGEVLVQEAPVKGPDPRRIFVFQDNGVFPWLTVEQNIGFGIARRPRQEQQETVRHYVQMADLPGL